MAREIKLNSGDWCDMIFEGKNKEYGAYALRMSSSKRHISAFLASIVFVGIVASVPSFLKAVKPANQNLGGVTSVTEFTNLQKPEIPEENVVRNEIAPPPPPVKATIQFTPPVITEDNKVADDKEMKAADEMLKNKNLQISIVDYADGSTDKNAIDPRELIENRKIVEEKPEPPITFAQQMPQYPGGDSELIRYIGSNLRYPTIAAENNIEGRVVIRFVVGKDGSVSDINVIQTLDPSCDKEAMRVVKSMGRWIPGMQNGRPVAVYYTLPILFRLQK
ncbi:MAG: TonB family protein [Dysgonomonas sp.]|nr:TonB family protein [Dysgonomonas sp.]